MWNPYRQMSSSQQSAMSAIAFSAVLALWACVSVVIDNPAQIPTPWGTAVAFGRLCWDSKELPAGTWFTTAIWEQSMLLQACVWSIGRIVAAGLMVFVIGVPVGILMGASPRINGFLSPLVDPFRSAPVASLLPVLVMWFGIGEGMKVTFLFLGSVVYLIPMVRDAIKAVPQTYWISAYDLGASPFEAVMKAVVPMAKPRIADAFVAAVSIEWTYITVAEYVNAESGLGQIISNARRISAMDRIFATILVIIVLALLTYRLMMAIKTKLYPWETER